MSRRSYEEVLAAARDGLYPAAPIRTAAGRESLLLGLSPAELAALEAAARAAGLGLVLIGSRVSGPRSRQRTLHPALAAALPLETRRRDGTALHPGAEGVRIDKTALKEHGRADPRTSDLTVFVVEPSRTDAELVAAGEALERALDRPERPFPIRVFPLLDGVRLRREEDFLAAGAAYLRSLAPDALFAEEHWRAALRELYCAVNLPASDA